MAAPQITNGESGVSVRGKLNNVLASVQGVAAGSNFSYRVGVNFASMDAAVRGSLVFDGTQSYPNKLGVDGAAPVYGGHPADTNYVAGGADVAAILAGYDNVNNALAGMIASQHSILYTGADHASIWGGSLHRILNDTGYSAILGGTQNTIEGRGRYAVILGGDQCKLETGPSDSESGFRGIIATSSNSTASGRNAVILGSINSRVDSTFGSIFAGENVVLTNGTHMGAGGKDITMGAGAAAAFSFAWGLNHTINGGYSSAFGSSHTISAGHDYSSARGIGGVTPFSGAHVTASRNRGDVAGRNQILEFQCSHETTDATITRLSTAGASNYPVQPEDSIVSGFVEVTGVTDAGVCGAWHIDFVSERVGAGSPTLRQNVTTAKYNGISIVTPPTMNATVGGIYRVQVVGIAATNIRWNAAVWASQIVFSG